MAISRFAITKMASFAKCYALTGKLILATIKSTGTVDKPKLSAELKSNIAITEEDKKKAEEIIRSLFNLEL